MGRDASRTEATTHSVDGSIKSVVPIEDHVHLGSILEKLIHQPLEGLYVLPSIETAEGHDGKTVVRLDKSRLSASDPVLGPMDLNVRVEHLELDERLKAKTPKKLFKFWDDFSPADRDEQMFTHPDLREWLPLVPESNGSAR